MNFSPGDTVRLGYVWPQEKNRMDGHKDRAAVIFKTTDKGCFAAPLSTVPPDRNNAPYAVPVPTSLQQRLGLGADKPSWVYANHANLVEMPSPNIQRVKRPGKRESSWTYGRMPSGLMEAVAERREKAIEDKAMHVAMVPRDPELEKYRSARAPERLVPGDPRKADRRLATVQQKAREKVVRMRAQESRAPSDGVPARRPVKDAAR